MCGGWTLEWMDVQEGRIGAWEWWTNGRVLCRFDCSREGFARSLITPPNSHK